MRKILILASVLVLFFSSGALAAFNNPSSNWQSQQPNFNTLYSGEDISNYWPILRDMQDGECAEATDFVIGIPPGGCSPTVVRSDLLAEQNVPVFCQLYAIKVNPLIKVSAIKSISFKGDYPEGVRSVVFHPARAAVKSYSTLLGDPVSTNIGYVVIILKQEKVEANMEEWVAGNLTASIKYDAEDAYGTGRGEYYLRDASKGDWEREAAVSSFWNGRGYLRASEIEGGTAKIDVMSSTENIVRSFNLEVGETSSLTYLPGFYCRAGLKVKLNKVVGPEDMALLNVDGEEIWVRKGSKFANGKCSVTKLDVNSNNDGSIQIKCAGTGKSVTLELKEKGIEFDVDGEKIERSLEEEVYDNWYLAYTGNYPEGVESGADIVILVKGSEDAGLTRLAVEKLVAKDKDGFKSKVKELIKSSTKRDRDILVIQEGGGEEKIEFLGTDRTLKDESAGKVADDYFEKSRDVVVDELFEYYGLEEQESGEPYGEGELWEEIVLAGKLGKFESQDKLMDLFVKGYPLSPIVDEVRRMRQKLGGADFSGSFASIYAGDEFKSISVMDFKVSDEGERKVNLKIGSASKNGLTVGWVEPMSVKEDKRLKITEINPGSVKIEFDSDNDKVKDKTRIIKEDGTYVFDGVEVYVSNVIVDEIAFVELVPEVKNMKSEANFTFRIAIEQRAIELTPEKTNEMLKNLNASIKKWEDRVEKLGNVVKGLKGVCFATSAVLMIKNMASGMGGSAVARQKVMEKYKVKCDTDYREMSRTECYNHFESDIESDIKALTASYGAANAKIKNAQKDNIVSSGGLLGGDAIGDDNKYKGDLREEISFGANEKKIPVNVGGDEPIMLSPNDLITESQLRSVILWEDAQKKGGIAGEIAKAEMDATLRNIALSVKEGEDASAASADLDKKGVKGATVQSYVSKDTVLRQWDGQYVDKEGHYTKDGKYIEGDQYAYSGTEYADKDGKTKVQYFEYDASTTYRLILSGTEGRNLGVREAQLFSGGIWETVKKEDVPTGIYNILFSSQVATASGDCENPWPKGTAKVSYYESGGNKGLPAIVPFDLDDGWYAMVANSGGTYIDDSPAGYKASGDVNHFKICNIGSNGVMNNGKGDDLCQTFNANTVGKVDDFIPCNTMSKTAVNNLYGKAREAIRRASQQYGGKSINIFDKMIEVGRPMSEVGGFECQDFMSASDCKLMFNVCDPVICPPSRCDLGGKYPVADVIQTGVIGSLVLCLPNAKEGVVIPICLSGIHAGLDAYLSILKSHRDCLQHSLDTGELVGICDEITAIYKCEFFWKQMSPLMNQVLPALVGGLFGSGNEVRGGGEYASVEQSWKAVGQGIDYYKNSYAKNALKAFNIKSTEEVGSTFCKAFLGTSVPGSASFLDALLEPESPDQFYASFSEKVFTDATVPATSQYKVYFHIYAGNDQGAQYRVYLKDPPATSYYNSNPTVSVKSGYIARGDSADETIDFTAPAGYKELCVVVNAKEECGFKSATTSFAVNYVKDKYVQDQAEEDDIKTEKDCVSGTPSALSMANLNVQDGVSDVLNPEIAMSGIVRICASANPEAGVTTEDFVFCEEQATAPDKSKVKSTSAGSSATGCTEGFECIDGKCKATGEGESAGTFQKRGSRWRDVGYCGDVNLRCWLDTESVEDSLLNLEAIEGTTSSILDERRGLIENERLSLEGVQVLLSGARAKIKALMPKDLVVGEFETLGEKVTEIIGDLDRVIGVSILDDGATEDVVGAGTNNDRAEALALKASVYRMICEAGTEKADKVAQARDAEVTAEVEGEVEESKSEEWNEFLAGIKPFAEIEEEMEAQNRVKNVCTILKGKGVPVSEYGCFASVEYAYAKAGVERGECFSDVEGQTYLESVSISYSSGPFVVGGKSCTKFKDLEEGKTKFDILELGDMLSIVWDNERGHNVIFLAWTNKAERKANVFEWVKIEGDEYEYRFYNRDLSDDVQPIYMIWKPVAKDLGGSEKGSSGEEEGESLSTKKDILGSGVHEILEKNLAGAISPKESEWASTIIESMEKREMPLDEEHVSLVTAVISVESSISADPKIGSMEETIQRKIEKLESGGFVDRGKAGLARSFYADNKAKLDAITTERELEKFIDSFSRFGPTRFFLESFRPETLGSMQLDVDTAIDLAWEYDETGYDDNEMRDILYDMEGGVYYGVLYLKEIVDAYTTDKDERLNEENVKFIAADYQAGPYTSRNAALQKQLNELTGSNLALDGKIGPKTVKVINDFLEGRGRKEFINKNIISLSKGEGLESLQAYNFIKETYREEYDEPEYAMIPSITSDSVKFKSSFTTEYHAKKVYDEYSEYCNSLGC